MSKLSKIIYFLSTLVFIIVFSQWLSNEILQKAYLSADNDIYSIVFVQNYGAAFSILNGSKIFLILFSAVAFVVLLIYTLINIKKIRPISLFFTALLSAGIFCNMCERMIFGFVRDFIKLNFVDFPVFNISDVLINIGVFALVIIIIMNNYIKNNETDN